MCASNLQYSNPQLRLLSNSQVDEIKMAALHIMEKIGIAFDTCPSALEILGEAGADISNPVRVKIPQNLVEWALYNTPKTITIYNRDGESAFTLNAQSGPHFGGSVGGHDYADPRTNQRRDCYVQDIEDMAKLVDSLPNIEWDMTCSSHPTVPGKIADMVCFMHVMLNMVKPVGLVSNNANNLKEMLDAGALVVGGENNLRKRPFIISTSEPVSPLSQDKDALEVSMYAAEHHIPHVIYGMPMAGATGPATFPGVLAVAVAEVLANLVLMQLTKQSAPVIFGSIVNAMDMKTCVFPYGAPELGFLVAALNEICHSYQLPMFGTAGCTDSDIIDAQTAAEITYQIMLASLSGEDLVHDIGLLHSGRLFSAESHTLANEIIGMVKVATQRMEVNDESLALDIIDKVGPRGNFLSEKHTMKHFRQYWVPSVFDRSVVKDGVKRCAELVREKTVKILDTYQPKPLPENIVKELIAIEKRWFKQADADYPYPKPDDASKTKAEKVGR